MLAHGDQQHALTDLGGQRLRLRREAPAEQEREHERRGDRREAGHVRPDPPPEGHDLRRLARRLCEAELAAAAAPKPQQP